MPIYCVETDKKQIAISFDAAWGNDDTETLIKILKEYNGKYLIESFNPFIVKEMKKYLKDAQTVRKKGKESMIIDNGDRTQFSTGAVRDLHEGTEKGRMDLVPLEVVGGIMNDAILKLVGEYIYSGNVDCLTAAFKAFAKSSIDRYTLACRALFAQ